MKTPLILIICLVSISLAGFMSPVAALEAVLEPMPAHLKEPVEGMQFQDDAFFTEADKMIKSLSNRTVPTGSQRMKVYSAYVSLRDKVVSPENYNAADAALAYLYYTSKTGEAYENYHSVKGSVSSLTDGSEFYDLADVYYKTAANWWSLIKKRYPQVTMYTLPRQDDSYNEDEAGIGTVLDGLKLPLAIVQKTPNTNKTYQDNEVKTTMERWIEDNIEAIPNQTDLKDQSQGRFFITSDGPKYAKSTYIDLSMKNVNPDFYDTANYIDAFLYFISQAREYYDQYIEERTSILKLKDGKEPYERAKEYYDQAGIALSLFKPQLSDINQTTALPKFPDFYEVKERDVVQEQEDMLSGNWGGTSWTGE